ncbi:MAG TPA: hypothetical protein VNW15_09065 [Rhizomicrobium sp.]|jgi:hypothetical protein|nr:hypothetical protein [Rhizomicrobium sp.]
MKNIVLTFLLLLPGGAFAQDMGATDKGSDDTQGMSMTGALGSYGMSREASGTSWQPDAAPIAGIMQMWGSWMMMLQGRVTGLLDSQSGPRGASMGYESGMGMAMATRSLTSNDMLGLRLMLSLDPFIGRRGYPLLLASGETADGVMPLVDRQHPHDFLMELAATYSHNFSESDSLFFYVGDPGEPALGPTAFMHRLSSEDDPIAPISHHWLDSTHVTFGVATIGAVHDGWKLEASRFTGREPDQHRFDFDAMKFDSTSLRLSFNPDDNWSLQLSQGFLKSPEQLTPAINENRVTASATYYNEFTFGSLAATIAWGNKRLSDGVNENGGLVEAEFKPDDAWTLLARGENIGSDELVPGPRVRGAGEFTLGAIHDWSVADHFRLGLGGIYSFDFAPSSPATPYGGGPHGAMAFVRLVAD